MKEKLERINQEKMPLKDTSAKEALMELNPDIESSLKKLAELPQKIQDGILDDLTTHRITGMNPGDLVERLEILIAKSHQLDWLDASDSDRVHLAKSLEKETDEEMVRLARERAADEAREPQEPPSTVH